MTPPAARPAGFAPARPPFAHPVRVILVLVGVGLAAWVLWRFDPRTPGLPGGRSLYPPCLFHLLTGGYCPGCGSTRALHAAVHGHWAAALRWNALAVCSLPLALGLEVSGWFPAALPAVGRPRGTRRLPPWTIHAYLWLVLAWWLLRNLPFFPWTLLAPHA